MDRPTRAVLVAGQSAECTRWREASHNGASSDLADVTLFPECGQAVGINRHQESTTGVWVVGDRPFRCVAEYRAGCKGVKQVVLRLHDAYVR